MSATAARRRLAALAAAPTAAPEGDLVYDVRSGNRGSLEVAASVALATAASPRSVAASASDARSEESGVAIAYEVFSVHEQNELFLIAADGTRRRRLGAGHDLAWSPRGDRFAFIRFRSPSGSSGVFDLVVASADGSNVRRVASFPDDIARPSWSPDGGRVAITRSASDHSSRASVLVVDVLEGGIATLATDAEVGDGLAWSPDGTELVYAPDRGGRGLVALGTVDGGFRAVTEGPGVDGPAWSPDGTLIAFKKYGELWVVRPDGTGQRRLSDRLAGGFSWSPDSRRIVFSANPNPSLDCWDCQIRVVSVATGQTRTLSKTPTDESFAAYFADGSKIMFQGTNELELMNADGTCETQLTNEGERGNEIVSWSVRPGVPRTPRLHCADVHLDLATALDGSEEEAHVVRTRRLGQRLTYRLRVRNHGDRAARNARLVVGGRLLEIRSIKAPNATCRVRRLAVCRLGTVGVGASRVVTLEAIISFADADRAVGARDIKELWGSLQATTTAVGARERAHNRIYVSERIVPCSIEGSARAEVVQGTLGRDRICAREGDDIVFGRGGEDVIDAGLGSDTIYPGRGRDLVRARGGDDRIFAADGERDVIACGAGNDRVVADRIDVVAATCEEVIRR